jgi:hypothetical protein
MSVEAETHSTTAVYQSMVHGIEVARNALEDARKKLLEYDAQYIGVSEKAGAYLSTAMQKASDALGDLGQVADTLKSGPAELPVKAITNGLTRVNSAFTHITDVAHQYDEKFQLSTRVSTVVVHPKEQATAALATIAAYASAAAASASAQLQGVSDGLRAKLVEACNAGVDRVMPATVRADELLHVSSTGSMMMGIVKDLNEKFGISGYLETVTAPVQSLDQKMTGGKVSQAISAAYKLGWDMVGAVQGKYEDHKREITSP